MKYLENFNTYNEDTSATGGPAGAVSGGDVSSMPTSLDSNSQPSSLTGQTVDPAYTNNGGKIGSYISVPYNAGSKNGDKGNLFQKVPAMGKDHGARTGQKSREKKLDIKSLKDIFAKKQDYTAGEGNADKPSKVMNYQDFIKNDITNIKK